MVVISGGRRKGGSLTLSPALSAFSSAFWRRHSGQTTLSRWWKQCHFATAVGIHSTGRNGNVVVVEHSLSFWLSLLVWRFLRFSLFKDIMFVSLPIPCLFVCACLLYFVSLPVSVCLSLALNLNSTLPRFFLIFFSPFSLSVSVSVRPRMHRSWKWWNRGDFQKN